MQIKDIGFKNYIKNIMRQDLKKTFFFGISYIRFLSIFQP